MTLIRWEWHVTTGYRELMRDPAVLAEMERRGERVAEAAGDGFEVDSQARAGNRQVPRVSVRTATIEARLAEARDHVLERAIDAVR